MRHPFHIAAAVFTAALTLVFIMTGESLAAPAREVRVAVAANFSGAAREIAGMFEKKTGDEVVLSFGSTGTLFAQISQGAPFDIYLAADQAHPTMAVKQGLAVAGSRFTYATGRLVLFSRNGSLVHGAATLRAAKFDRIAIANPATAPYGAAAVEVMRSLGAYATLSGRIVEGENVTQTYQFVATGNAPLGFVALSQVIGRAGGSRWLVPEKLHAPIAQDAVLLERGAGNPSARAFLAFLEGPEAAAVKKKYGYVSGH